MKTLSERVISNDSSSPQLIKRSKKNKYKKSKKKVFLYFPLSEI